MGIARNCPYSDDEENCRYEIFAWQPRLNKCPTCERFLKKRFPDIDTSRYNIDENGNVLRDKGRITDNTKTLYNALDKIKELEKQSEDFKKGFSECYAQGEQDALKKLATVICNDIGIGISAMSILAYCTEVENNRMYPPADADDFERCRNLLSAFPKWKEELKDIGKKHKNWGTVGEHWLEIEEAYSRKDYKSVSNMLYKYRHEVKEE